MRKKKPESQPEPDEGLDVTVDIDPEHEWRMLSLQSAGFTAFQSFRLSMLAAEGKDWRQAVQMREQGASFETIYNILA